MPEVILKSLAVPHRVLLVRGRPLLKLRLELLDLLVRGPEACQTNFLAELGKPGVSKQRRVSYQLVQYISTILNRYNIITWHAIQTNI